MDRVILSNLAYYAKHGVWTHEKEHGQKFVVSLELYGDYRKAGVTDNLEDALDYTAVYGLVSAIVNGPSLNLLEALAESISVALLDRFPLISKTIVKVEKPGASLGGVYGSVGVEITRERGA